VLGGPLGWLPAPAPPAQIEAWPGPSLVFGLLAAVDLGRDAANTFARSVGTAAWSADIARRWAEAPGRISLIGVLLRHREVDALHHALGSPPASLSDPAGRALCHALATLIHSQRADFARGWELTAPRRAERLHAAAAILPTLQRWRRHLYAAQGAPPPLLLLDVPALGRHGRATTLDGRRVVALDLGQPAEHVLLQAFHEEVHPVTDPVVLAELPAGSRDTRPGQPGWEVHQELERVAVASMHALLTVHDSTWLPALERWRTALPGPNLFASR
jgi:hypothetical protein